MAEYHDISYDVLVTLRRIIRAIDMHSKKLGKEYGLTGPQLMILKEIRSGQDITIGHVAKKVALSQATVTNIIDRLEKREMVTRERSTQDKRRVLVHTTEKADEILDTNPSVLQADFINSFQTLESWEQNLILSSLQRIATMMHAENITLPEDEISQLI
jgi:DNA-binding MarR family transcriptional regulator